jgi:hypothetical protein
MEKFNFSKHNTLNTDEDCQTRFPTNTASYLIYQKIENILSLLFILGFAPI